MIIDTPELAQKLYRALLLDAEKQIWLKDSLIKLEDGSEFMLPVQVFKRERQPGKEGVRFEFINHEQRMGEGEFGRNFLIAGTLQADQFKSAGRLDKHGQSKERLVKIQVHDARYPPALASSEYRQARKSNHLHIKRPVFHRTDPRQALSYTVMRRMPGCELLRVISDDIRLPEKKLSLKQRFELSIALLQALKTQVHDHGIIHRDIKLENIFVNMDADPISVSILDYGLAVNAANPGFSPAGNMFFAAPEQFRSRPETFTQSLDVYAMARIVALIFRVSKHSYREYKPRRSIDDMLGGLFYGIDDISDVQKTGIRKLLELGLQANPGRRLSLESFLAELQKLSTPQAEPAPSEASTSSSGGFMPALASLLSFFSTAPEPALAPKPPAMEGPAQSLRTE
ncbi:protein kinase domain-containing protein [Legionella sp. CNM-4043-24]|uniref:protein kinase domain-containing protein n=1 Tax=Legionella sp. CNM-4043-24 TaxID=3421646 RepID=UPI00403B346E